jgi:hypothetical protein
LACLTEAVSDTFPPAKLSLVGRTLNLTTVGGEVEADATGVESDETSKPDTTTATTPRLRKPRCISPWNRFVAG